MFFQALKKSACFAIAAILIAAGFSAPASATLIGDEITISSQANIPVDTWTDTVTVGTGIELDGILGTSSPFQHVNPTEGQNYAALYPGDFIDVDANTITIFFAALASDGFPYAFITDFLDLDWMDGPGFLTGVTLNASSTGVLGSNISAITAHSFQFQATADLVNGAEMILDLTFEHGPGPGPNEVPEPATLLLFAVGLLSLAASRQQRSRR